MATGENVSGKAGVIPVDLNATFTPSDFLNDTLNNLGASTSSASSTSSVSSTFGDTNIASGKSTAGSFGVVKGLAFAIVALAAFAIYEYAATKGGK